MGGGGGGDDDGDFNFVPDPLHKNVAHENIKKSHQVLLLSADPALG